MDYSLITKLAKHVWHTTNAFGRIIELDIITASEGIWYIEVVKPNYTTCRVYC